MNKEASANYFNIIAEEASGQAGVEVPSSGSTTRLSIPPELSMSLSLAKEIEEMKNEIKVEQRELIITRSKINKLDLDIEELMNQADCSKSDLKWFRLEKAKLMDKETRLICKMNKLLKHENGTYFLFYT